MDRPGQYFSLPLKQRMIDEPSEYQNSRYNLVISNIEANFQSFTQLLVRQGVIDKYLHWTFADNHLIIIGDGIKPDFQGSEYLWFIYSLEEKARIDGGYVHFILGGKEGSNLHGNWRYEHPKYAVKSLESKRPSAALYYGNNEIWRWLRTKNIIEKIGSLLFVPCGISPAVNVLPYSLQQINDLARKFYTEVELLSTNPEAELLIVSKESPLKYKGYFDGSATEEQIDHTLLKFGINIIITGYDAAPSGPYFNGKVINISSIHKNKRQEGLFVKRNHFYKANDEGKRKRIK
jgi:hypothetical protein